MWTFFWAVWVLKSSFITTEGRNGHWGITVVRVRVRVRAKEQILLHGSGVQNTKKDDTRFLKAFSPKRCFVHI